MADTFKVRRDSSTNNVPTVGYNEGVDAQDVILFGACKVTEQLTTDGVGRITLTNNPVSISGITSKDNLDTPRGRSFDEEITITSVAGSTKYYAGSISPVDRTLKVYSNSDRTVVTAGTSVYVTYYKRVPLSVNSKGEIAISAPTESLPVTIKGSDISLGGKEKTGILLKKEMSLAAGASANALDVVIGNADKEMYITSAIAYYDGTGTETDPYLSFWFDVATASGSSSYSIMDLPLPPKTKAPMQVDFGQGGLKIPAGSKLRFRVNANFTTNKIHTMAIGYQY